MLIDFLLENQMAQYFLLLAFAVLFLALGAGLWTIRTRRKRDAVFFTSPLEGAKDAFPETRAANIFEP